MNVTRSERGEGVAVARGELVGAAALFPVTEGVSMYTSRVSYQHILKPTEVQLNRLRDRHKKRMGVACLVLFVLSLAGFVFLLTW